MEIEKYREYPFFEVSKDQFYTFCSVKELIKKSHQYKEQLFKCRTLGILSSINGCFFLKDLDLPLYKTNLMIRISMAYVKSRLKTTSMPQPVQIFGTLQWKSEPTVFVKYFQVLDIPTAIKLKDAIKAITEDHLAIPKQD
ncbi:uncharacterized protein LOC121729835 isoform X1 [Aricia agestis]|uniref:uncharacterized protein LOC121729835 isoform X1 n=1 Tax=Aricia agestis TaxID=91739 RepID=UPI001C20559C|nr:uncharacterized protein LOC121729835 isoform X1 [Aricia agestis]